MDGLKAGAIGKCGLFDVGEALRQSGRRKVDAIGERVFLGIDKSSRQVDGDDAAACKGSFSNGCDVFWKVDGLEIVTHPKGAFSDMVDSIGQVDGWEARAARKGLFTDVDEGGGQVDGLKATASFERTDSDGGNARRYADRR